MQMFLESADHSQYLFDRVAENPEKVLISSFGIYCGITYSGQDTTEWGDKYRLATRDLMEMMRGIKNVYMLIGVAPYKGCKGNRYCQDCEIQYAKSLLRLAYHAELFPQFKWKVSTDLHLKCAIFSYPKDNTPRVKGVAGGRNFTDSSWADVTFELDELQAINLAKHTIKLWELSPNLTDSAISDILNDQGIAERTMNAII